MISLIVALDKNNLIGVNNNLPWHYPEDLRYFKEVTLNKTVLMGRKTFNSIVKKLGKPLPKRTSIVVTRDKHFAYEGVRVINDLEAFLSQAQNEDIFIIGGKQIYEASLAYVKRMYITHIDKAYQGDTYLEGIDYHLFTKISTKKVGDLNFCVYERR